MKKKLLITILLMFIVVGIGYWYYHSFKGGPKQSLLQAAYAVQMHNASDFERYVDVESVTDKLVDQFADQADALQLVAGFNTTMLQALRIMKPMLRRAAQHEVQQYVRTGKLQMNQQGPLPDLSVIGMAGQVIGASGQFKGIRYVREQGDQALVGIELVQPAHDTTSIIELKMVEKGDHWQVVEVTNTGELIRQAVRWKRLRK